MIRPVLRTTIRTRLTLMFGGLFLAASSIVLFVADDATGRALDGSIQDWRRGAPVGESESVPAPPGRVPPEPRPGAIEEDALAGVRTDVLESQQRITLASIAVIGVLAFALCWWLTGRALRPVHLITATARRLSLSNLDERIAMKGPRDELRELADTFDAMLDRLARAAEDQRRFAANASHELRTPLAVQRAAIEIGLDGDPPPERVAAMRTELLLVTERSQRLIDGLLALAQGERGPETYDPVDLAAAVRHSAELHATPDVELELDLAPVTVTGEETLLARLVDNLVENAFRHNHPGGRVTVRLTPADGLVVANLVVTNTGPVIDPDRVTELFQPFRRLHPDRTGPANGAGLGLSIVAAIARAHDFGVTATPNPAAPDTGGGLTVRVTLPEPREP